MKLKGWYFRIWTCDGLCIEYEEMFPRNKFAGIYAIYVCGNFICNK